ncbi:MAG: XRE family transcriptional regulator [Actinomycetota bacterium]
MANERLRRAMTNTRTDLKALARAAGVDPKTAQRWLNGRIPHPRHRWAVAQLLSEDELFLWPDARVGTAPGAAATPEILSAYARRADFPPDRWWKLFQDARRRIDLLGYAMLHLPEQHPAMVPLLHEKAHHGCHIRVTLADPRSPQVQERDAEERLDGALSARIRYSLLYLRELAGADHVEIRYHATPMYNSVFRFDDDMIVTPHRYGTPGYTAPLLHLRRLGPYGIFEAFAEHFEAIWQTTTPLPENPSTS